MLEKAEHIERHVGEGDTGKCYHLIAFGEMVDHLEGESAGWWSIEVSAHGCCGEIGLLLEKVDSFEGEATAEHDTFSSVLHIHIREAYNTSGFAY